MLETGLTYKPHIDGLRAIAVVLVILFHLQPSLFPAGYLGVDIFFVISGFVISQSLYQDYIQNGKINIRQFYKKRFKRLYPALLTMVAVTTLVYVLIGFLWDTNLFVKTALTSIFAVSNLYFLKHGDDYFTQDLINPLLHTWSLGVEEQFYFVYPVLLALGLWYTHKRNLPARTLFWVISSLSLILYVIFASNVHDIFSNFYFPTARFWELGIGCALFFFTQSSSSSTKAHFFALPALLLMSGVLILQPYLNNIYVETLGITLAAAGVIYAGINTAGRVLAWLQSKALVFIGKISYSLYLWHLPVIYISNLYLVGPSFYLGATAGTVACALLSYYCVERPLRYSYFLDQKFTYLVSGTAVAVALLCIGGGVLGADNTIQKINKSLNSLDDEWSQLNYIESKFSLGERIQPNFEISGANVALSCEATGSSTKQDTLKEACLKQTDNGRVFFLTGDSHAMHLVPMFNNSDEVDNFYFRTFPSDIITNATNDATQISILTERSSELKLLQERFDDVFYVLSLFLDQEQYDEATIKRNLDTYIGQLDKDINIVLVAPTPVFRSGPESCVILGKYCTIKRTEDLERSASIRAMYTELDQKYENVDVYDPYPSVCPEDECVNYSEEKDFLLYRDDDHLSVEGSKSISPHFDTWFSNRFKTD